jgi:hypothetical protein
LEETMEVNTGALVSKLRYISMIDKPLANVFSYLIVYVGNDSVTFCEVKQRQWPLSVDSHDRTLSHSVWVRSYPSNVPIEVDGCRVGQSGEGREARQEALQ